MANKSNKIKNYRKNCGCLFDTSTDKAWYACEKHATEELEKPIEKYISSGYKPFEISDSVALSHKERHTFTPPPSFITQKYPFSHSLTKDFNILSGLSNDYPGDKKQQYWLYALKLEKEKYYIGITAKRNPYWRITQHVESIGANWTRKFRPLKVMEIRDLGRCSKKQAEIMEQNLTLIYMKLYGTNRVRGGRIVTVNPVLRFAKLFITLKFEYILWIFFITLLILYW